MADYILIKGSEDGNPVSWLTPAALASLLANPEEYCGVRQFLEKIPYRTNHDQHPDPDPNYWNDGQGILLKVEVVVPRPGAYRLPEDDE